MVFRVEFDIIRFEWTVLPMRTHLERQAMENGNLPRLNRFACSFRSSEAGECNELGGVDDSSRLSQ